MRAPFDALASRLTKSVEDRVTSKAPTSVVNITT